MFHFQETKPESVKVTSESASVVAAKSSVPEIVSITTDGC